MIIYNGKNSEKDFDLDIASVDRPPAVRKEITEKVPYMSGLWDFSYHDGDVDEYEPVTIKYTFDVIADTKRELNEKRDILVAWIHSKGDGTLYDTDVSPREYYEVYTAKATWSEVGEQGLLTAEFLCYPFRKSPKKLAYVRLNGDVVQTVIITNTGFRKIMPTIIVEDNANISDGVNAYSLSAGTYKEVLTLEKGTNTLTVTGNGALRFEYQTEVL